MKKKDFFWISLTIFIIVFVWMIADIYHATQEKKIEIPQLPNIKNYNLDVKILDQLMKKNP